MKKVIRLTESDLANIVKRVIDESDVNDSIEIKIETSPEGQDITQHVEELFGNKTPEEIKKYFLELKNRKPKLLKRLLRWFHKNRKNNTPFKKQNPSFKEYTTRVLTNAAIWIMVKQVFGVKIKDLLNLPSIEI